MKRTITFFIIFMMGLSVFGQEPMSEYFKKVFENDKLTPALKAEKNKQVVAISYEGNAKSSISASINTNEILVIYGKTIPSSGYQWSVVGMDENVLEIVAEKIVPIDHFGTTDERIVLRGMSAGITEFKLVYCREGQENNPLTERAIKVRTNGKYNGSFEYVPTELVTPPLKEEDYKVKALPSYFDWRDQDMVTSVKDQGSTNACWAFAACGSFEAAVLIAGGPTRNFSEQWLGNCNDYGMSIESGGWYPQYMFEEEGGVLDVDCPLQSQNQTCRTYTHYEKASGWNYVDFSDSPWPNNYSSHTPTTAQIKQAIYDHGPVAACVAWNGSALHMIVITGWDDSDGTYIVKNSWGTYNGDNGYDYIGYNQWNIGSPTVWIDAEGGPNVCNTPTNLSANPQSTEADLSWSAASGATEYQVAYRVKNASDWTYKTASSNSYTLTGLSMSTTYEWSVQTICSGSETSDWTDVYEFTTGDGSITETIGNTTVFGNLTDAVNRRAAKYVMPEDGTLKSICMYHEAGSGNMILAVYDGESEPNNLLGKTGTVTVSGSAGWQTVNLQSPVYVESGTTIWLAWVLESNPGILAYTSGSVPRADAGVGWSGGMPSTFGSSSLDNYSYSIYANYTPETTPPTCDIPTGLNANPSTTSADLSWNAVSGAEEYQVSYRVKNTSDWAYETASSNSYTLRNLSETTTYEYAVQTICSGSETSDWTDVYEFTTSDGSSTETVGNTTVYSLNTTAANRRAMPFTMPEDGTIESVAQYHQGGSGNMYLAVYEGSSSTPTNRIAVTSVTQVNSSEGWQTVNLTSPIYVEGGSTIWLAWVYENTPGIAYTDGSPGRVDAGVGYSYGMPESWGSTASQANYIYSVYANYTPGGTPTCSMPTGLNADPSTTSADLSWSAVSGAEEYQVSYRVKNTSDWAYETASSNSYALRNLSEATTYEYAVQTICSSSETSGWTDIYEFTTEGGSVSKTVGNTTIFAYLTDASNRRAVRYTMPESGTLNSISIYHEAGYGSMILAVYSGSSQPGTLLAKTNTVTVSGSAGWQTVDLQSPVYVEGGAKIWLAWVLQYNPGIIAYTSSSVPRADAGIGWSGGMPSSFGYSSLSYYSYSIYANYTVGASSSRPIPEIFDIEAYPVPCSDILNVNVKGSSNSLVRLIGMNGVTVYEKNLTGPSDEIDVSEFAAGIYNLVVTSDEGSKFKKIIIK